jgi:hypothetical protein
MGGSMGNPMGINTVYSGSQGMYVQRANPGYVGKSRLKTSSAASVRSKSMKSGMSRRSHMSKRKPTKRFNEELDTMSRKSKQSYYPSRGSVKHYKPQMEGPNVAEKKQQVLEKINKMDDNIDKLKTTFNIDKDDKPAHQNNLRDYEEFDRNGAPQQFDDENKEGEQFNDEESKKREEEQLHEEIDSLYYGSNYSGSRRSDQSRRSDMTSATYISKLEKELQEERRAREKLAKELEEIKKISSEISSHLGLKQNTDANNN